MHPAHRRGAVLRSLARLLRGCAAALDRAAAPERAAAGPSTPGPGPAPAPTEHMPSAGPPADWLERVRRGAPQLLDPNAVPTVRVRPPPGRVAPPASTLPPPGPRPVITRSLEHAAGSAPPANAAAAQAPAAWHSPAAPLDSGAAWSGLPNEAAREPGAPPAPAQPPASHPAPSRPWTGASYRPARPGPSVPGPGPAPARPLPQVGLPAATAASLAEPLAANPAPGSGPVESAQPEPGHAAPPLAGRAAYSSADAIDPPRPADVGPAQAGGAALPRARLAAAVASESVARQGRALSEPLPWDGRQPNRVHAVEDRWRSLPPDGAPFHAGFAPPALAAGSTAAPPPADTTAWHRYRPQPNRPDPIDDRWPSLPAPTAVDLDSEPVVEPARLRRLAREQQGVPWSEWPS